MTRRTTKIAVAALLLAVAFWAVFAAAKQVPSLAAVNPTAEDPYDAVGSFAVQAAFVLGLLAVWRAWHLREAGELGALGVARATLGVCSLIAVTLLSDLAALVRHAGSWTGSPAGLIHVALLAALAALTVTLAWATRRETSSFPSPPRDRALVALLGLASMVAVLALYPDSPGGSVIRALIAVVVGATALFVPARLLAQALIPAARDAEPRPDLPLRLAAGLIWALVALIGVAAGGALLFAELFADGGGGPPAGRVLLVVGVYVGLEAFAVLLGYAMLRSPLGLPGGRRPIAG